jgi:hypothetical protein
MSLKYLEYLNIIGTNATAAGIKNLMNLPKLKMVYAQGTKITTEERFGLEAMQTTVKLFFSDSMKSAITDTLFAKKTE